MNFDIFEELLHVSDITPNALDEKIAFYEQGGNLCTCGNAIKCTYGYRLKPEYAKCKVCKKSEREAPRLQALADARARRDATKAKTRREREQRLALFRQRRALLTLLKTRAQELSGERRERYKKILAKARKTRIDKLNSDPLKSCAECGVEKRLSEFPIKTRNGRHGGKVCSKCKEENRKQRLEELELVRLRKAEERLQRVSAKPKPMTAEERRLRKYELKKKYRNDPMHRVNRSFSNSIRKQLKAIRTGKSCCGWKALVGYTLLDLKRHLEQQFEEGMTWDNYGKWHIDHIRPKSSYRFEAADDPQFLDCWSLSNLRPLWAEDNIRKGAKWEPQYV